MNRRNLLRFAMASPLALLPVPQEKLEMAEGLRHREFHEEWDLLHEQAKEHWAKILEIVIPQVENQRQKEILLGAEVEDGFEKYINVKLKPLFFSFSFVSYQNRNLLEKARKQVCPDWGITLKTDSSYQEDNWQHDACYWYSTRKPEEI
jgi:hypothetical protein